MNDVLQVSDSTAQHSLAEASRPFRDFKEQNKSQSGLGRKRKAEDCSPNDAVRVNWQHPLLWPLIARIAAMVGHSMSPSEITTELKKHDSHLFS